MKAHQTRQAIHRIEIFNAREVIGTVWLTESQWHAIWNIDYLEIDDDGKICDYCKDGYDATRRAWFEKIVSFAHGTALQGTASTLWDNVETLATAEIRYHKELDKIGIYDTPDRTMRAERLREIREYAIGRQ